MKKILILGNDSSLSDLRIEDIPKDVTTVGLNRSYMHIKSDYLSFCDTEILMEMLKNKVDIKSLNCICPDWLLTKKDGNYKVAFDLVRHNSIPIIKRKHSMYYVFSISMAIDICLQKFGACEFYLYATSLKFNPSKNHFWTGSFDSINKNGKEWYELRFPKMCKEIINLSKVCKIYSSTKESLLNDYLEFKDIKDI
jgi:hypothetical protein